MGLCQSQDTGSRRRGGNRKNTTKRSKRDNKGKHRKRRDSTESSSVTESSESDPDSDHDSPTDQSHKQVQITSKPAPDAIQNPPISQEDQDILFYKAPICESFLPTPIPHEVLRNAMKLALLAPSAYNCCPMRAVFISSDEGKERLMSCTESEEVKRIVSDAPCTVVICTDLHYTKNLPKLMPYVPNAQAMFEQYDDLNEMIMVRNCGLQAGYLVLAIRSLGMAVGPILDNFSREQFDEKFLADTVWRSSLLISFGYAKDPSQPRQNIPTLSFDIAAKIFR